MCSVFQAAPAPQEEISSADEAQAAKRPRLPSNSAPPTDTPMEMTSPSVCPQTAAPLAAAAPDHHSISAPPTSESLSHPTMTLQEAPVPSRGSQMDAETPMDTLTNAFTESPLVSDPTLTPQSTPFQATLNSDPLLSAPSPPPLPLHMSDSYTPSSGYVSYMETLLHSHFPQDDGSGPLY